MTKPTISFVNLTAIHDTVIIMTGEDSAYEGPTDVELKEKEVEARKALATARQLKENRDAEVKVIEDLIITLKEQQVAWRQSRAGHVTIMDNGDMWVYEHATPMSRGTAVRVIQSLPTTREYSIKPYHTMISFGLLAEKIQEADAAALGDIEQRRKAAEKAIRIEASEAVVRRLCESNM